MRLLPALITAGLVLALAACEQPAPKDGGLPHPPESSSAALPAASPSTTAPSPERPKPQSHRGHGDKIVRIRNGEEAWLATFTHTGGSNFIVSALDPSGEEGETLVNAIGHYKGTVLFNAEDGSVTKALKIKADGAWTVRLKPPSDARVWSGDRITGKGDDVFALESPTSGFATTKLSHSGSANFIVDAYSEDGTENLVNEIGRYSGEVPLPDGTILITVHADGRWTLART